MYAVIEFGRSSGGGIAIVRNEWMTPRKKECFWPPFKQSSLFNRCLLSKGQPEENWTLHDIERIFYKTDDIGKAREKLRKAESDSEVVTELDEGGKKKRKRKPVKKLFVSSSSEDDELPLKLKNIPKPPSPIDNVEENITHSVVDQHNVSSDGLFRGQTEEVRGHRSSQDFTTSPLIETPARSLSTASPASEGLNVLASHLAKINRRLDDMEKNQNEILARLGPTTPAMNILPPDIKLPCETLEEINDLEDWLLDDTNKQSLTTNLSLLGGKKVGRVVRNILEKIFTNDVAEFFNWTGRHKKRCLRDLAVIKLIPGVVRKQRNLSNATQDEVNANISNWFRFSKDRNGGREQRRKEKPRQDYQD